MLPGLLRCMCNLDGAVTLYFISNDTDCIILQLPVAAGIDMYVNRRFDDG